MSASLEPEIELVAALERCRSALEHHLEFAQQHGIDALSNHLHNEASIATQVLEKHRTAVPDTAYWQRVRNLGGEGGAL